MVSCDNTYFLSETRVLSPGQTCVNTCHYFVLHSEEFTWGKVFTEMPALVLLEHGLSAVQ